MERATFSFNITYIPASPVAMDTIDCVSPTVLNVLSIDKKEGNSLKRFLKLIPV